MRNHRSAAVDLLAAGIGLSAGACSLAVDAGRDQCVTDNDCTRLGAELPDGVCISSLCRARPDPNWVCLDEPEEPSGPPVPDQIRIIVPFVDLITGQPVPGVDVRACGGLDTMCGMPLAMGVSNERGEADLRLPGGFNGYLIWRADNVYPTIYFFGAPLTEDDIYPVDVISPQVFAGLNAQFQGVAIEGRPAVVVNVQNCSGAPAAGVSIEVPDGDSETEIFYLVDNIFPPSQTETTAAGVARIINVPTGNVSIIGTLDGREIGRTAVLTQPGFATLTNLMPTPLSAP